MPVPVTAHVPFSGAMVPNRFFRKDARLQSVMVEVRRDLYMDEESGERHAGFARMRSVLTDFRSELARFAAT